jgi:hypothetical protein
MLNWWVYDINQHLFRQQNNDSQINLKNSDGKSGLIRQKKVKIYDRSGPESGPLILNFVYCTH